jgi:hypothetical protein
MNKKINFGKIKEMTILEVLMIKNRIKTINKVALEEINLIVILIKLNLNIIRMKKIIIRSLKRLMKKRLK